MKQFRTDGVEYLEKGSNLTFLGMDVDRNLKGEVMVSQTSFIRRMTGLSAEKVIDKTWILLREEQVGGIFRSYMGGFIWASQTRFDMAFLITKLGTTSPYMTRESGQVEDMIKSINKIVRGLKGRGYP